jgi:glycosyltransferase involved in cell wall biosynthesis
MACGRPVVAFARGGATETVEPGVTGWLVDAQTPDAFADAMQAASAATWDPARLVERAAAFAPDRFASGFRQAVDEMLSSPRSC